MEPDSADVNGGRETAAKRYKEAEALFKQGRKTEALQMLRDLDREFPDKPDLIFAIALVRKALGHTYEAEVIARRLQKQFHDPRGDQILDELAKEASQRAEELRVRIDTEA